MVVLHFPGVALAVCVGFGGEFLLVLRGGVSPQVTDVLKNVLLLFVLWRNDLLVVGNEGHVRGQRALWGIGSFFCVSSWAIDGFAGCSSPFPLRNALCPLRDLDVLPLLVLRHGVPAGTAFADDLGAFCVTHIASDSLDVVTDVDHVRRHGALGLSGSRFLFWYLVLCVACCVAFVCFGF